MHTVIPPFLEPGDTVALVAPGFSIQDLSTLHHAVNRLTSWGLQPVLGQSITKDDGLYAGTDQERLADMQTALDSPDIKAIFCFRGGYGLSRIIDQVDLKLFQQYPKWLIGYSDITALHLKINALQIATIHAEMPLHWKKKASRESLETLFYLLQGKSVRLELEDQIAASTSTVQGTLVGGNLSVLVEQIGTINQPDLADKIFFVEEYDEPLYRVDRMLNQLKRTGLLQSVQAVLVGYISGIPKKSTYPTPMESIFLEHLHYVGIGGDDRISGICQSSYSMV